MNMRLARVIGYVIVVSVIASCSLLNKQDSNPRQVQRSGLPLADTTKSDTTKKRVIKPYTAVVTKNAVTDSGLLIVHHVDEKYLLEVPASIFDKELLVVTRISKSAAQLRGAQLSYGYAGDPITEKVIKFTSGPNNKLFIRTISYGERASDSSENGMYRSVKVSNLDPIAEAFDVLAYSTDSSSTVVDVSKFFNEEQSLLYSEAEWKKILNLQAQKKDFSYVASVRSFPVNVEVKSVKTYSLGENDLTATFEINTSIVLLPALAMEPRYEDERVGYFSRAYWNFDAPMGARPAKMITRWRLEPAKEDEERYLKGELVEPKKPIVFYIDPATPKKWVPYLIQGVNDWQGPLEKAGFKNAICAKEAPLNDSSWSLYDARHSAIVYKPSLSPNAIGPHIHDPRTGEILESHIHWFHNVQQLLHDWYFVQASPNDTAARNMQYDDELMGQLIRFVCAHEVGHTLGLAHNFGSSSTVPTDSLRSKTYLEKYGHTPSIMDYARFNYVAQPEDGISRTGLMPRIGMYDEWAIEWGYRWFPETKFETAAAEKHYLENWITEKVKADKRYWYGPQRTKITDPRCQFEDLGDDAIKAGTYGIRNLQQVMKNIVDWSKEPGSIDYTGLKKMYNSVLSQYVLYVHHVINNVYLNKHNTVVRNDGRNALEVLPRAKRKNAVAFINANVFRTPEWLQDTSVFNLVGTSDILYTLNRFVLQSLVNAESYGSMLTAEKFATDGGYTFDDLLTDLESEIWRELNGKVVRVDFSRRGLQKAYAEKLIEIIDYTNIKDESELKYAYWKARTDYMIIIRDHARRLSDKLGTAYGKAPDRYTKLHMEFIKNRLKKALSNRVPMGPQLKPAGPASSALHGISSNTNPAHHCWHSGMDWVRLHDDQVTKLNAWETYKDSTGVPAKFPDSIPVYRPKLYHEIITAQTITDSGLFIVHKVDERYFFEIPVELLEHDILVVSNIIAAPSGRSKNMIAGLPGDKVGQCLLTFSKDGLNKLFIKGRPGFVERADDTTENGMRRALNESSFQPILASFEIKAYNKDSTALVIETSDYLNGDLSLFFSSQFKRMLVMSGSFKKERSFIEKIESFPQTVEIRTVKTYNKGNLSPVTYVLHTSMIRLPDKLMKVRKYDPRVGYSTAGYLDFDAPGAVKQVSVISRWRLEPKENDINNYLKGELVEPKKPIIFYLDSTVPQKWAPYLIAGVNAWQKAFEKAGFKNAIFALPADYCDSTASFGDGLPSVVSYQTTIASDIFSNLLYPNHSTVVDPRTGEILQARINWKHNIQQVINNWYFMVAPADPRARKLFLDDSLTGAAIQSLCTNIVGLSLGLLRNAGASSVVPVDSLRSKTYLAKYGCTPSVMDPVRFNYVAQPEDGVSPGDLIPKIGVYDEWAIEWGYRWFPENFFKNDNEEKAALNDSATEKNKEDKRFWFSDYASGSFDPRVLPMDVGDDAVVSGSYGIKNLKRVMDHFVQWAGCANDVDLDELNSRYKEIVMQYMYYLVFSFSNVTGNYKINTTRAEKNKHFANVLEAMRQKSLKFVIDEFFTSSPIWLFDPQLEKKFGIPVSVYQFQMQRLMINSFINLSRYHESVEDRLNDPDKQFWFDIVLSKLEQSIFSRYEEVKNIGADRRMLQKMYVEKLIEILDIPFTPDSYERGDAKLRLDYPALIQNRAKNIIDVIDQQLSQFSDRVTLLHLKYLRNRLRMIFNNEGKTSYDYQGSVHDNFSSNIPGSPETESLMDDEFLHAFFTSEVEYNVQAKP